MSWCSGTTQGRVQHTESRWGAVSEGMVYATLPRTQLWHDAKLCTIWASPFIQQLLIFISHLLPILFGRSEDWNQRILRSCSIIWIHTALSGCHTSSATTLQKCKRTFGRPWVCGYMCHHIYNNNFSHDALRFMLWISWVWDLEGLALGNVRVIKMLDNIGLHKIGQWRRHYKRFCSNFCSGDTTVVVKSTSWNAPFTTGL